MTQPTGNQFMPGPGSNPFMPAATQAPAQMAMPFDDPTTPVQPAVVPMPQPGMTPQMAMPAPGGAPMPGSAIQNDSFEVDLTEVSSGFTIPDGMYPLRCVDVSQGVSNAGNPQFIWDFVITQGEQAGKDMKLFTALTPAAMWKVAEVVVALGVGQVGQQVKFKKSDVVGKECVGVIEKQTYKGNERSSITKCMTFVEAQASTVK